VPGWGAYCTSKAALDRLTGVLAEELSDTGIVVNGMSPGATNTGMQTQARRENRVPSAMLDHLNDLHQRGLLFEPDEAAQLNLWLASRHAPSG